MGGPRKIGAGPSSKSICILHKFSIDFCLIFPVDIFPKIYYNKITKEKGEDEYDQTEKD